MYIRSLSVLTLACLGSLASAQTNKPNKTLDMYFVDTEGGLSALYVSPTGQSLLIDTGSPGGRDTDRIMDIVKTAGLTQIDYLIITHYHGDHIGGLEELSKRIPIKHFTDHGETGEHTPAIENTLKFYSTLYNDSINHLECRVVCASPEVPVNPFGTML